MRPDWDHDAYYHRLLLRHLPGAQVRRLVFWHYFLLWHKPARTA